VLHSGRDPQLAWFNVAIAQLRSHYAVCLPSISIHDSIHMHRQMQHSRSLVCSPHSCYLLGLLTSSEYRASDYDHATNAGAGVLWNEVRAHIDTIGHLEQDWVSTDVRSFWRAVEGSSGLWEILMHTLIIEVRD
jgi:hypothetical protein